MSIFFTIIIRMFLLLNGVKRFGSDYWYRGFLLCEMYKVTCVHKGKVTRKPIVDVDFNRFLINSSEFLKIIDSIKIVMDEIDSKHS